MTTPLTPSPTIRRHADGSINYDFYRIEAKRQQTEQHRAAWRWLSRMTRNAIRLCKRGLSVDRRIDIVTSLR